MKVSIEKNELVIRVALVEPHPSSTGKTMHVIATGPALKSDCIHPKSKRPITVALNAYFKPE